MKPWVSTVLKGAAPLPASERSSEDWNQPRCWSLPSRYMSHWKRLVRVRARVQFRARAAMTAREEEPESIHTSSVSFDLVAGLRPFPIGRLERGPQLGGGLLEPDIRAVLLDQGGGVAHDLRVEDRVALRVVERRDRHAPGALARDAPVGPALDGGLDAGSCPSRAPSSRG